MTQHNNLNVDESEISKFEELASRWWDPNSEFKPLHDINPLRLNFINEKSPLANKRVLDVGCGGGILSESMAKLGAHVTGIDMGQAPLSVAKLHSLESNTNVSYQKITVEELADSDIEPFDIITCLEMLEHVPSPGSVVNACSKVLKPEGHAFFSTINRNPKSYVFAIIGAEYVLNLLPKGTHEYAKFIKPSELSSWCRQSNLNVTEMTGMTYNPLTKIYKLNPKDLGVNYIVHATKG